MLGKNRGAPAFVAACSTSAAGLARNSSMEDVPNDAFANSTPAASVQARETVRSVSPNRCRQPVGDPEEALEHSDPADQYCPSGQEAIALPDACNQQSQAEDKERARVHRRSEERR